MLWDGDVGGYVSRLVIREEKRWDGIMEGLQRHEVNSEI